MSSETLTYVKIFLEFMQITVKECLTGAYSLYNDTQQHNQRRIKMTATQFAIACNAVSIPPDLALENDKIVAALQANDDDLVMELLCDEF